MKKSIINKITTLAVAITTLSAIAPTIATNSTTTVLAKTKKHHTHHKKHTKTKKAILYEKATWQYNVPKDPNFSSRNTNNYIKQYHLYAWRFFNTNLKYKIGKSTNNDKILIKQAINEINNLHIIHLSETKNSKYFDIYIEETKLPTNFDGLTDDGSFNNIHLNNKQITNLTWKHKLPKGIAFYTNPEHIKIDPQQATSQNTYWAQKTNQSATTVSNNFYKFVVIHEIGHALGLKHTPQDNTIMFGGSSDTNAKMMATMTSITDPAYINALAYLYQN